MSWRKGTGSSCGDGSSAEGLSKSSGPALLPAQWPQVLNPSPSTNLKRFKVIFFFLIDHPGHISHPEPILKLFLKVGPGKFLLLAEPSGQDSVSYRSLSPHGSPCREVLSEMMNLVQWMPRATNSRSCSQGLDAQEELGAWTALPGITPKNQTNKKANKNPHKQQQPQTNPTQTKTIQNWI